MDRGYTRLVVQKGAGAYAPTRLLGDAGSWRGRLRVELSSVLFFPVSLARPPCRKRGRANAHISARRLTPRRSIITNTKNRSFEFTPSLAALLGGAALVVSHAGSGSVFEALAARRPLVVVPNPILMDNHQAELAEHLARAGVAACAEPDAASLAAAVRALDPARLAPYEPGDPRAIAARLDRLMGRPVGVVEAAA